MKFLLCGLAASSTVLLLLLNWESSWKIALIVLVGIAAGVLGVMFVKPVVIASTSVHAGTAVVSGVMELMHYSNPTVSLAAVVVLTALFVLFQLKNAKDS